MVRLPSNADGLAWHKISDGTTVAGQVQEYVPVHETAVLWSQIITVKRLCRDRDPKQIVAGAVNLSTTVHEIAQTAGGASGLNSFSIYHDALVRNVGGWRFAARRVQGFFSTRRRCWEASLERLVIRLPDFLSSPHGPASPPNQRHVATTYAAFP
jgi:hypothetical protein